MGLNSEEGVDDIIQDMNGMIASWYRRGFDKIDAREDLDRRILSQVTHAFNKEAGTMVFDVLWELSEHGGPNS